MAAEWKETKLIDFMDFNPVLSIKKNSKAKKVPMEMLLPFTRKINGYEVTEYKGGSKFQNGDTLLARITPCLENGKTAFVSILEEGETAFGSTEFIVLRAKKNVSDPFFIYYLMRSPFIREIAIKSMIGSSGRQRVQQDVLENLEICLPPLEAQQKIAKILSSLDEKIELNNKINENLHAQAQAIFKSWFVDFEPFGGTMPSDWEEKKVCDVFDITIGKTPPRKELCWFSHKESDIRWLSISDMKNNDCYALTSSEYLTKEAIKKFNIKVVSDNTVLLSFKLTIGRVSIACGEMATNEAIAHFNTDDKELVEYLYCYLKNYNYQSLGNTSSIATAVNSKIIKTIPFILPTREVIEDFHSIIVPYFGKIKNNILENIKLAQIRYMLLPKLMSGELEV